ncbi:glycosyltransferase [Dyella sp. LX-66]|uniref:glycosyltransferase n=1 Tax=unclassified Dyella TaxID=2634549 RepID=UPI001BE0296A|nr:MULTISPECIES: glycosyltransferase [unclassified Dyella]MBT2117210.1 glycosyltransferase [Dyella sp. LX-1]MBT2138274.1 glycosyltransferase [Dyella sp. LX-66]
MPLSSLPWRVKRLRYLSERVLGSIAQRGLRGTLSRVLQEFRPLPPHDLALELLPLEQPFEPFEVPHSDEPRVTVIIPVYGKLAWTLACLRSIAHYGSAAPIEILVVDDASPDETAAILAQVRGLRVLSNQRNLGFIHSCNAGAAAARAPYLLFLNNDTQVTAGWLDRLLQTYLEEPGCGIAGSQLVYPDGRLQEAGALVYNDGEAWNVGRFERRDDPRYLYRRDVDYVSGAALLIERALFLQLGGFDVHYEPAYCEDMDLAFAVRAAGRRVVYEPASVVIHCEGISSGTDLSAGTKQYQLLNRAKFIEKWADALKRQPARGTPVNKAIHAGQRHIFVMDALTPDPRRDAGSLQLYNIMRLLRGMGWRVTFMADNAQAGAADLRTLGAIGVRVLCKPTLTSLAAWLKDEGAALDAVLLCRHYVADANLPLVQRMAPQARLLFDTVDVHFLREQRAADHTNNPTLARRAAASQQREIATIRACHATFVVSTVELELLQREVPEARVMLLPNMHEVHGRRKSFEERRGLIFVGGFGHPPNVDAVQWLVGKIFPKIRAARPEIELHLIGQMPEATRQELHGNGVVAHGRVEDLDPWMDGSRIALAPLRYGAGVKGKVNTAMSHGLPVVATSIAAEGMFLVDGQNVLVADDTDAYVAAVLRLYDDPALWLRLSEASLRNIQEHFSPSIARATLEAALA